MRYWPQKPPLGVPVNWGDPLARGLVGCWLMNEGSGNRVYDLSGNGRTGTFGTGNFWTSGKFGPCIDGDYTNSKIDCGVPKYIQGGTECSASGWIYIPSTTVAGNDYILIWSGSGNDVLRLYTNTTEDVVFSVDDNATHTANMATWTDGFLNNPGWHHCVGTMDGSFVRLYVDGKLRASTAWPGGIIDIPTVATLGLAMCVDPTDVPMLWSRALINTEVQQLYMTPFRICAESF